jgi:excinuclease UvrABC nuclease subunit
VGVGAVVLAVGVGALEVALGEAAQRAMEAFYGDGGGARGDPPDAILVPHALPDAPGLERIIARASTAGDDAGTSDAKGRRRRTTRTTRTLCHGSDLPEGLPAALASLAKANAAEAARRAAREAAASAAVADIVGVPGRPIRSIEGVDVSHLAGSATAASVVKFTDGAADPAGHRRYDLDVVAARPDGGGGTTGFDGDDPGAIYAAVARRCAGKRGVVDLPDLLLIDGGVAQLAAAARALSDAGVVVVNARAPDGTLVGTPGANDRSSNALGPARRVALASLAKGRLSGEEAVYVPAVATSISDDDDDDTLGVAPFARGAHKAWCSSAAKGKDARGGPGLELLRAVRDESHAAALGAHRRRRRSDLFRETRGQGAGESPGPGVVSDFGIGSGAGAGDSSDEEEREMSALG